MTRADNANAALGTSLDAPQGAEPNATVADLWALVNMITAALSVPEIDPERYSEEAREERAQLQNRRAVETRAILAGLVEGHRNPRRAVRQLMEAVELSPVRYPARRSG